MLLIVGGANPGPAMLCVRSRVLSRDIVGVPMSVVLLVREGGEVGPNGRFTGILAIGIFTAATGGGRKALMEIGATGGGTALTATAGNVVWGEGGAGVAGDGGGEVLAGAGGAGKLGGGSWSGVTMGSDELCS